jgi:hypothetical protein
MGQIQAFLLTQATVIDLPGRVRLDLLRSVSATSRYTVARNPVERAVADNFIKEPRQWVVNGTLSANPLVAFGGGIGTLGSFIRRDLVQTRALRLLQARGEPLAVVMPSEVAGSVALVSIAEQHTGPHKVELSLQFEEIEIVSPSSIVGELDLEAALAGADATQNMGSQPVSTMPDPGGFS